MPRGRFPRGLVIGACATLLLSSAQVASATDGGANDAGEIVAVASIETGLPRDAAAYRAEKVRAASAPAASSEVAGVSTILDRGAPDGSTSASASGDAVGMKASSVRFPPGSDMVLSSTNGSLHLKDTEVIASGPTGSSVSLQLSVSFAAPAAGATYPVSVLATDDLGHKQGFILAGSIRVR